MGKLVEKKRDRRQELREKWISTQDEISAQRDDKIKECEREKEGRKRGRERDMEERIKIIVEDRGKQKDAKSFFEGKISSSNHMI